MTSEREKLDLVENELLKYKIYESFDAKREGEKVIKQQFCNDNLKSSKHFELAKKPFDVYMMDVVAETIRQALAQLLEETGQEYVVKKTIIENKDYTLLDGYTEITVHFNPKN